MQVSIFITIITALHNINLKKEIKTMIIKITFFDKEDLVQFETRVLEGSGTSFAPCPFDSEILENARSLKGFEMTTYAADAEKGKFCCAFRVPRSSFESVESIRALFDGYTEIRAEKNEDYVKHNNAKVFEFALVNTEEEMKKNLEMERRFIGSEPLEIKQHRSDELMAERFDADKISSPSP